jgi:hypothetical protein
MIELIKRIHQEPEIDPLLQLVLIDKVIGFAMEGSEPLKAALAETKKEIGAANLNFNVPWMDPDDDDASRLRPRAAEVSKRFSPWTSALQAAEEFRKGIEHQMSLRPVPIGWLAKEKGIWTCLAGKGTLADGTLELVIPEGDSASAWIEAGAIAGGRVTLSSKNQDFFVEGRPVFLMTSLDSKP